MSAVFERPPLPSGKDSNSIRKCIISQHGYFWTPFIHTHWLLLEMYKLGIQNTLSVKNSSCGPYPQKNDGALPR